MSARTFASVIKELEEEGHLALAELVRAVVKDSVLSVLVPDCSHLRLLLRGSQPLRREIMVGHESAARRGGRSAVDQNAKFEIVVSDEQGPTCSERVTGVAATVERLRMLAQSSPVLCKGAVGFAKARDSENMFHHHLENLFRSLQRDRIEPPRTLIVGEIELVNQIREGSPCLRVRNMGVPEEYEVRFRFLMTEGYPWINVSYYGTVAGCGLIVVELPGPERKDPALVGRTSVNLSGPAKRVIDNGGDAGPFILLDGALGEPQRD